MMRMRKWCSVFLSASVAVLFAVTAHGAEKRKDESHPEELLQPLLGIAYRDDGAQTPEGRYTRFSQQMVTYTTPGLNCSGFVTEAARLLLNRPISLSGVSRDRLNDSGENAAMGHDWDFGWDVIMNLSEGLPRRMLLPKEASGEGSMDPVASTGLSPRGYALGAYETWRELEDRVRPDHVYLLSFSKSVRKKPYTLLHYHVGLLLRGEQGGLILYQTTHQSGISTRRDLSQEKELQRFIRDFATKGTEDKRLAVIEVALPMQ